MTQTYLEVTSSGTSVLPLESKLLAERKLFLCGNITSEMACDFTQAMLFLMKTNEPIDLFINSGGGDVNAGLVIYDLIRSCRNEIRTYCIGKAFSMAAVILAGCQRGRRYILPHSQVMIHEAMLGGDVGGTALSIRNIAERLSETQKQLNDILSRHTGRSLDEIANDISFDNFMNAETAVRLGFCDKIVNNITEG